MRLLVETHIHSAVTVQLAAEGVDIVSLANWMEGDYRTKPDNTLLEVASKVERVLVTYDIHTIPPLVKEWADAGRRHAGVIFITGQAARINDVGAILCSLRDLLAEQGGDDWWDRVIYLSL
jgi:hypothetical protein